MSVLSYFVKRPRAEIEADERAAVRDEFEPKGRLTPAEAARIIQRRKEAKLVAGQPVFVSPSDQLEPALRHHMRLDPDSSD